MKLGVRVAKTAEGFALLYLVDEKGKMLPGQRSVSLSCPFNFAPTVTVEFVINGKEVKLMPEEKDSEAPRYADQTMNDGGHWADAD